MRHTSVATIDHPEFINLQPCEINPLMSKCEVKVLYVGENRNRSLITKEKATEISKTLRGVPIVGYYNAEREDFRDHGEQITIEENKITFKSLTRPYGFISPDAKIWFQYFIDKDDFGNDIRREYLMTEGFLWTQQYPECKAVIDEGRGQSMEFDEETLDGNWSKDYNRNIEFFIVNDAIFSKLCILGEDVEPCFEGASVTAPEVSSTFSTIDNNFKHTLYTMMQDLKTVLEGGQQFMQTNNETISTPEDKTTEFTINKNEEIVESNSPENFVKAEDDKKDESQNEDTSDKTAKDEDEAEDKFACGNSDDDKKKKPAKAEKQEDDSEESVPADDKKAEEDKKDEDEKSKKEYALLEEQYTALNAKFEALNEKCQALEKFKNAIDDKEKDALINSFYMLSDADKEEVITNKANFSLEDIEAKLSVICFRKHLSFDRPEDTETQEVIAPATTFNLDSVEDTVPAWVKAIKTTQKNRNI